MNPRTFNLIRKRLTAGVSSSLEPADEKHLARMEEFLERPAPRVYVISSRSPTGAAPTGA
jgi:hypothetical protein